MTFLKNPTGNKKAFSIDFLKEKIATNQLVKIQTFDRHYTGWFLKDELDELYVKGLVKFGSKKTENTLIIRLTDIQLITNL